MGICFLNDNDTNKAFLWNIPASSSQHYNDNFMNNYRDAQISKDEKYLDNENIFPYNNN